LRTNKVVNYFRFLGYWAKSDIFLHCLFLISSVLRTDWCVAADCGAVIDLASGASHTIKSPGYDDKRYYLSYQGCSWWIKVITVCWRYIMYSSIL